MVQNGSKWSKMVPNGPKWLNRCKMVKNCQNWSKMVYNGPKRSKMVQNSPNGRKRSKIVKDGGPDLKRAQRTGLSARRARRTKSRGPKGLQLEVGARRAPRLLFFYTSIPSSAEFQFPLPVTIVGWISQVGQLRVATRRAIAGNRAVKPCLA